MSCPSCDQSCHGLPVRLRVATRALVVTRLPTPEEQMRPTGAFAFEILLSVEAFARAGSLIHTVLRPSLRSGPPLRHIILHIRLVDHDHERRPLLPQARSAHARQIESPRYAVTIKPHRIRAPATAGRTSPTLCGHASCAADRVKSSKGVPLVHIPATKSPRPALQIAAPFDAQRPSCLQKARSFGSTLIMVRLADHQRG